MRQNNRGKAECLSYGHNPLVKGTHYLQSTKLVQHQLGLPDWFCAPMEMLEMRCILSTPRDLWAQLRVAPVTTDFFFFFLATWLAGS